MERKDLKKILAGFSIAGLVGAGLTTVAFVQPAAAAWSGSKQGAVSTPAVQEATVLVFNQKPVKNIQELKQILDTLAPGANVAITYMSQGKNMAIEGVVKQK